MMQTPTELESFHAYLSARLANGRTDESPAELLETWLEQRADLEEEATERDLAAALADLEAG